MDELKLLDKEDIIWIIYIFLFIFALYSNKLEREYIFNKDKQQKINASKINTFILVMAFFIYIYFASLALKNLKRNFKNENDKRIAIERLIVSLLFVVGGIFAIYTDYDNNTNNLDIAIF